MHKLCVDSAWMMLPSEPKNVVVLIHQDKKQAMICGSTSAVQLNICRMFFGREEGKNPKGSRLNVRITALSVLCL